MLEAFPAVPLTLLTGAAAAAPVMIVSVVAPAVGARNNSA
jgi:hypothetical protein